MEDTHKPQFKNNGHASITAWIWNLHSSQMRKMNENNVSRTPHSVEQTILHTYILSYHNLIYLF
jgi:hypothetical protein